MAPILPTRPLRVVLRAHVLMDLDDDFAPSRSTRSLPRLSQLGWTLRREFVLRPLFVQSLTTKPTRGPRTSPLGGQGPADLHGRGGGVCGSPSRTIASLPARSSTSAARNRWARLFFFRPVRVQGRQPQRQSYQLPNLEPLPDIEARADHYDIRAWETGGRSATALSSQALIITALRATARPGRRASWRIRFDRRRRALHPRPGGLPEIRCTRSRPGAPMECYCFPARYAAAREICMEIANDVRAAISGPSALTLTLPDDLNRLTEAALGRLYDRRRARRLPACRPW